MLAFAVLACGPAARAVAASPAPAEPARVAAPGPLRGICVLSRDTLYTASQLGLSANQRLTVLRQEAQAETDTERQTLQADTTVFEGQRATLNPALLVQLQDSLAVRRAALAAKIALRVRELEKTRQTVTAQIDVMSLPVIKAMEKVNQCTLLFIRESVLDGEGTIDITPVVIDMMNAQLRSTPFPRIRLPIPEPDAMN